MIGRETTSVKIRVRVAIGGGAVLAVVAVVAAVSALGAAGPRSPGLLFVLTSLFTGLMFGLTGALLIALRPGNAIGLLLAVAGSALTFEFALRELAFRSGSAVAGWLGLTLDPLFFPVPIALLLLLFPDGRLPSRRWRPVLWLGIALTVVSVLAAAVRHGPLRDESYGYDIDWAGLLPAATADRVAGLQESGLLILLAAVINLVVRFARSTGTERQRLKPLSIAGGLAIVFLVVQVAVPGGHDVGVAGFVASVAVGFPIALAVGALRYRVWDLDQVLVAAIVYGALTVLITAVYVGVVVLLGRAAAPGLLPTVIATALVAVLFAPVKEWLGRVARRLVLGVRATPYEALAALPHQLAEAPVVADVLPGTARALTLGLGVPAARVRAFGPEMAEAWYPAEPPGGDPIVVVVRHLGEVVGDVAVLPSADRPLSTGDRRLLADLAAQAGPALRGVILTEQLQARLRDLTASRQRIVTAQTRERRRLERDIHDGVQQHLVALAVSLRGGDLAAAQAHLDRCIQDLRDLARGIYPPMLATRGLAAALKSRARTTAEHVRIHAEAGRLPEDVELTAYFACLEVLQNAAKHAPGADVTVELAVVDGWLTFAITDEGPGFDPAAPPNGGTGLIGLADRLGAAGGDLTVESRPGAGTTIRGRLPVPADDDPFRVLGHLTGREHPTLAG